MQIIKTLLDSAEERRLARELHLPNSMGLGWGQTRDPWMKKVNYKKMKMKEKHYTIILTYVEVDMECYWTVNVILTDAEWRSIWLSLLFNNTPCLPKQKSTIVLLYNNFLSYAFPAILDH